MKILSLLVLSFSFSVFAINPAAMIVCATPSKNAAALATIDQKYKCGLGISSDPKAHLTQCAAVYDAHYNKIASKGGLMKSMAKSVAKKGTEKWAKNKFFDLAKKADACKKKKESDATNAKALKIHNEKVARQKAEQKAKAVQAICYKKVWKINDSIKHFKKYGCKAHRVDGKLAKKFLKQCTKIFYSNSALPGVGASAERAKPVLDQIQKEYISQITKDCTKKSSSSSSSSYSSAPRRKVVRMQEVGDDELDGICSGYASEFMEIVYEMEYQGCKSRNPKLRWSKEKHFNDCIKKNGRNLDRGLRRIESELKRCSRRSRRR